MAISWLSKLNFILGRNPRIEKRKDWRLFIPEPYSSVLLLQADFELAWGWCWSKRYAGNIQCILDLARLERSNIPEILDLCDNFEIPITWATVGHLLLESCRRKNDVVHQEIPRLKHLENEYWKFSEKDWFKYDPGTDVSLDPEWYASDLINEIMSRKVKHEIGCHTFSHIDCRDGICTPEILSAELLDCQRAAALHGIKLETFVHPAHTIGNLNTLIKYGFTSFRTDFYNILGFPEKHGNGLWELKSTMELTYRKEWSSEYHIYRYRKIIDLSIKNNAICLLWFHPSLSKLFLDEILPAIFSYLNERRKTMLILKTNDYMTWLNKNEHEKKP